MKKIQSKVEALECSQHYTSVFRRARADNSGVGGGTWPKFELIQAFMHVLLTCKNEVDHIKNEGARVFTRFLPLQVYGDFSRCPRAGNSAVLSRIWPNLELVRDIIDELVTCKYEEDPIKNEGARVFTTLYSNFSDTQGQITLELVVVSGRNLNSSSFHACPPYLQE